MILVLNIITSHFLANTDNAYSLTDFGVIGGLVVGLKLSYDFAYKIISTKLVKGKTSIDDIIPRRDMNKELLDAIIELNRNIDALCKAVEKQEDTLKDILKYSRETHDMHCKPAKSGDREYSWEVPETLIEGCVERGKQFSVLINEIKELTVSLKASKLSVS